MLNLGCGHCVNPDWVNVDFVKTGVNVISHNLLEGIPFLNNEFDVVYHSHLLEHFSKVEGTNFIKECYRVLKPGGIIRIAVPDLETISKEYLNNLQRAINNDPNAEFDYDWIMLEMYDQTVRNQSGGEMAKYLFRTELPNREYVFSRIGDVGKYIQGSFINSINKKVEKQDKSIWTSIKILIKKLTQFPKSVLIRFFFRKEYEVLRNEMEALKIGRFRLSGEVHQWMYDRYSLNKSLKACGFKKIRKVSAFESYIKDWIKYELDGKNGIVRKPDSLFMEAMK